MTDDKARRAFERWHQELYSYVPPLDRNGHYTHSETRAQLVVWNEIAMDASLLDRISRDLEYLADNSVGKKAAHARKTVALVRYYRDKVGA